MTEPVTQREVERKLRVHALFRLPPIAGVAPGVAAIDPRPAFTMRNTYVDTPDLRLFRWGITLRRREGGPDEGWHLKLPVDGADSGTRDEMRLALTPGDDVPEALRDIVAALVREARLTPVVTLRTERTPILLLGSSGEPVAELVDDTVAVLDGERVAAIFREIEVEGIPDASGEIDAAALEAVVARLVDHGAVPGTLSKAAAALGPRTSAPPDVPEPRWPGPDDRAGEAVRAYLATQVRRLLLQDVRLRRGLPDAVHQVRVAARRLRSGLRVFRPLLDGEWADRLRAELGWAAGELGAARDTEVLLARLDAHAALLPPDLAAMARAVVDPALAERMERETQRAREHLAQPRYAALLEDLVDAARDPRLTALAAEPARAALPPLVAAAWARLAKDVRRLDADSPSEAWHETRIAAKRARYAVEAVVPVLGGHHRRLAESLAGITDILGTHQDAYVAQEALRDLAERADGPQGFALGRLHAVEVAAELADRDAFRHSWPAAAKAAHRAGLG